MSLGFVPGYDIFLMHMGNLILSLQLHFLALSFSSLSKHSSVVAAASSRQLIV